MPWLCLRRQRHSPVLEGRNYYETTEICPALLTIFGLYLRKLAKKKRKSPPFAIILKEDSMFKPQDLTMKFSMMSSIKTPAPN